MMYKKFNILYNIIYVYVYYERVVFGRRKSVRRSFLDEHGGTSFAEAALGPVVHLAVRFEDKTR